MTSKIFITGATGCVGHYLLDLLTTKTDFELHLLIRTPGNLPDCYKQHSNIHLHPGSLDAISDHHDAIKQCDILIHIATAWHDDDYATTINVDRTIELMNIASQGQCKKIIYFSTASILDNDNQPNPHALELGPMYVKSKYLAHQTIQTLDHLPPVYTVFPTLVMGGNDTIPYSHISGGLKEFHRYIGLLRFFSINGCFHFIHCKDIAEMVLHLCLHNHNQTEFVLGQEKLMAKQAIKQLCQAYNKRVMPQIPLNTRVILTLAKWLRIKIDPWGQYCAQKANMSHSVTNPSHFGLKNHFPTLVDVVNDIPKDQKNNVQQPVIS